jgi:hypothetical protein
MIVRTTLRLPEDVHKRIERASHESGRSLNQVMVDALRAADLRPPSDAELSDFEKLRRAVEERAPGWNDDDDDDIENDDFFNDGEPVPEMTNEELWKLMPKLPPEKWLSRAVIEDREDRV